MLLGVTKFSADCLIALIAALMWTVSVEVLLVGGQYGPGVPFVVDQHMVGALPLQR